MVKVHTEQIQIVNNIIIPNDGIGVQMEKDSKVFMSHNIISFNYKAHKRLIDVRSFKDKLKFAFDLVFTKRLDPSNKEGIGIKVG